MQLQPYLFFHGRCDEALAYYQKTLGAEIIMRLRFADAPEQPPPDVLPPGNEDKVMHASVRIGSAGFMASDGCGSQALEFKGFSLSLDFPDEAAARRAFAALAEAGKVDMPIGKTFWSPCFGMVTDPFGIQWMIGVEEPAGTGDAR